MRIVHEFIDPDADRVVRRLSSSGYQAYLVGGCVRDLLLNRTPKDFDVSCSATPMEIKRVFRNCRIIGRRFRLAHIFFGNKIIETATFRANPRANADANGELLIHRDNVWGSDTEDAQRRDFTINGLFYDVETELVIDHVNGLDDLKKRLIRTIGDPDIRFQEDPVRILRAIKFAARLGFDIEETTYQALLRQRADIRKCSQPRVVEEFFRLLLGGAARRSMEILAETDVISCLSSHLGALYHSLNHSKRISQPTLQSENTAASNEQEWAAGWAEHDKPREISDSQSPHDTHIEKKSEHTARLELAWNLLGQLDRRAAEEREVTNALALACTLAAFVIPDLLSETVRPATANAIIDKTLQPLISEIGITRRDAERTAQILQTQRRLQPNKKTRHKPSLLVQRDYFDESLSLYELMAAARGDVAEDVDFWRTLQKENGGEPNEKRERKRRRGGRRRHRPQAETNQNVGEER